MTKYRISDVEPGNLNTSGVPYKQVQKIFRQVNYSF